MYLFKSLIKCNNCKNNFRGKNERHKNVYICGGYSKESSSCSRYVIHESDLINIIDGHLKLKGINVGSSLIDYIEVVEVQPNIGYKIIYKDGTHSLISQNGELGIKYKL